MRVLFYNFFYMFGYLFFFGIYVLVFEEKNVFEEKYIVLLCDMVFMIVEDLVMKYLGVDIMKCDFWENVIKFVVCDVEVFL